MAGVERVPPDLGRDHGRGTCFGYEVDTALSLLYLREGRGERLEVSATEQIRRSEDARLVYEWLPLPPHQFPAQLFQSGPHYQLSVAGGGWFDVDPANRTIVTAGIEDPIRREHLLWGVPCALCFLHRGDLAVHASAVDLAGSAALFAAPGRFGKSTMAAAFLQAGHRVLSEDLTCVRPDSTPSVIPGPAMLRLRRDIAGHFRLPLTDEVHSTEDRITLRFRGSQRGNGLPVPLQAIILLRETSDAIRTERVPATEAIRDLWVLNIRIPGNLGDAQCFAGVTDLVRRVPVWNLYRPLTPEQLPRVVDYILSECLAQIQDAS